MEYKQIYKRGKKRNVALTGWIDEDEDLQDLEREEE